MSDVKSSFHEWRSKTKVEPKFEVRPTVRLPQLPYVGVGNSTNKKDAEKNAARDFVNFLVRSGKISAGDVPSDLGITTTDGGDNNGNASIEPQQPRRFFEGNSGPQDGFSKDGGYNREIIQQFDCSATPTKRTLNSSFWKSAPPQSNGFCETCNEAQRLKVEKLAQFEPKWESRFNEELKAYKAQLEAQYRLCGTCDRHLKSVLRDKKKMVLGSKLIEYIVKGAEIIKKPQSDLLRQAKEELWKRRLSFLITVLTAINIFCLFGSLPELNRNWFTDVFGLSLGTQLFMVCSHVAALWRVITTFTSSFLHKDFFVRMGLFARTIFMMLLYSLGLRLPQLVRLNFLSLYMLAAPFCILASTFSYNVLDRFRITRYTLLLVMWSIYAGGLIDNSVLPVQQVLMFLTSVVTCLLAFTNKVHNSWKLYEDTASSFHKIYSDDLTDGDTITSSLLSQFDCSSVSNHSDVSRSFGSLQRSLKSYGKKSPLTSSTLSLNTAARPVQYPYEKTSPLSSSMLSLNITSQNNQEPALNSSFKSCYLSENNTTTHRTRFGNSPFSFASPARNPFLAPNAHLNGLKTTKQPTNSNVSFGNASFTEQPSMRKNTRSAFQGGIASPAPSFRSSFASTNNILHYPQRPSRLLSPTRLSFNTMNAALVDTSKNSFAQHAPFIPQKQVPSIINATQPNNFLFERQNGLSNLCPISEEFSRASSRSSGFESQSGHVNNSRENSCCPEMNDMCNRTCVQENSTQFQAINGFTNDLNNTFTIQKPLLSPFSNYDQPLSVNCSSEWNATNRYNPMSQNSFNLRRINQNVPNFRRGDLLRKWKEGEAMS